VFMWARHACAFGILDWALLYCTVVTDASYNLVVGLVVGAVAAKAYR
jgi:hypothetical protein